MSEYQALEKDLRALEWDVDTICLAPWVVYYDDEGRVISRDSSQRWEWIIKDCRTPINIFKKLEAIYFDDEKRDIQGLFSVLKERLLSSHKKLREFLDEYKYNETIEEYTTNPETIQYTIDSMIRSLQDMIDQINRFQAAYYPLYYMNLRPEAFYDYCLQGQMTEVEIYNYIERQTSGFDAVKTGLLFKDFTTYYSQRLLNRFDPVDSLYFKGVFINTEKELVHRAGTAHMKEASEICSTRGLNMLESVIVLYFESGNLDVFKEGERNIIKTEFRYLHEILTILISATQRGEKSDTEYGYAKGEQLALDELLKLGLYDFFDYCRYVDGVPKIDIQRYIETYTNGFKANLVHALFRDFSMYFDIERDIFYSDENRIKEAVERYNSMGKELPTFPDVDYIPPPKLPDVNEERYQRMVKFSRDVHDSQRGTLDVKKLLSYDSLELNGLRYIEYVLEKNMDIKETIAESQIEESEQIKGKPIGRDAIRYLFVELRNRNVITGSMSDTDLSDKVSALTGYSAEQIRKNAKMTDKAKKGLIDFLSAMINKLQSQ